MSGAELGRVQLLIMQVLWRLGKATAREITDELNKNEAIAHSTVQTLLRGLEDKQSISHEIDGRTFRFYALVQEGEFKQSATSEFLKRVFGGSVESLVSHLLSNEKVSREELGELKRLINRRSREES